jgi:hypothetical protein
LGETHDEARSHGEFRGSADGQLNPLNQYQDQAKDDERGGDDIQIANITLNNISKSKPKNADWETSPHDCPCQLGVFSASIVRAAKPIEEAPDDVPDFLTKIDKHCGFGSNLHHRGKGRTGIAPAK